MKIIGIDPGVVACGVIVKNPGLVVPDAAFVIEVDERSSSRIKTSQELLSLLSPRLRPFMGVAELIAIEEMDSMGSARGLAAASDVLEVSLFVGVVVGWAVSRGVNVVGRKPCEWKGNMKKKMVIDRIKTMYRRAGLDLALSQVMSRSSHDWDALGIALNVEGKF